MFFHLNWTWATKTHMSQWNPRSRSGDKLSWVGGVLETRVATAGNAAAVEGGAGIGGDENFRIHSAVGNLWLALGGAGGQFVGQMGSFSHESEHDLALMVRDFLENGSSGAESRYSSDSDSGLLDFAHLTDKILFHKHTADQYESDLSSIVRSIILSLNEADLYHVKTGPCNASCVRQLLVKLLRSSGYDAGVCISKWQGVGKVPGGDHEYIDVVPSHSSGSSERLIVDIDFRSHFEIARAVESYDAVLNSLPVVYVGSLAKLKRLLQVMVEAARSSLKQNSMPLPPWRSLAYLEAKWESTYERELHPDGRERNDVRSSHHIQCIGHLRAFKASLQTEVEAERLLKPIMKDNNRRGKLDRWRHRSRIAPGANNQ
ncbi:Protein of unknown function DUF506 [Cinnamomum micranthum f. kanehirae]|uniref:Plant-specific domain TIGR01615 family protein n=1 Tax=Cinnamomum micranthum f. kanehirae TaxID=337451 RepID=A0A3S3MBH7_9MAGN|nr:Protein of unknown function DUF506 [Cinnamomum micranthum f. kanehirae]